jgi:hypothetical protein
MKMPFTSNSQKLNGLFDGLFGSDFVLHVDFAYTSSEKMKFSVDITFCSWLKKKREKKSEIMLCVK